MQETSEQQNVKYFKFDKICVSKGFANKLVYGHFSFFSQSIIDGLAIRKNI